MFGALEKREVDLKTGGKHEKQNAEFTEEGREGVILADDTDSMRTNHYAGQQKSDYFGELYPAA